MLRPLSPLALPLLAGLLCAQADLQVVASSPGNNTIGTTGAPVWRVAFDRAVQPGSLAGNATMFGRWSGVVPGQVTLDAGGTQMALLPARPLFPGEQVTVALTDGVTAMDGGTLARGFTALFWVAPATGTGTFTQSHLLPCRTGPTTITYGAHAGDLDRDGAPDITTANEATSDLRGFKNDGCGQPQPMTVVAGQGQPSPLESADFDGDGWLDIVSANLNGNAIAVFLNDGQGNLQSPPLVLPTGGRSHGVAVLDADADGRPDIATSNRTNVLFFRNLGNGAFAAPTSVNAGNGEDALAAADADGDGIADLFVACDGGSTVALLRGDGHGGFTPSSSRACGGQPFQIAVGDIDGDGDADALTANRTTNTIGIVRGDGAGNLVSTATLSTGSVPVAVDLGDLDGDGDLDAIASCYGNARHYVYLNLGNGTFLAPQILFASQNASCATLVDFDRDGILDILSTDEGADEVRIYLQDRPLLPDVQPQDCFAALRVDNWAVAGYGGRPPRPVPTGTRTFFGVTAAAAVPFALLLGPAVEPGLPLPFGLANLDPPNSGVLAFGFLGDPAANTNAAGEGLFGVLVPPGLLGPIQAQGVVLDPRPAGAGFLLTNPVGIVFVP